MDHEELNEVEMPLSADAFQMVTDEDLPEPGNEAVPESQPADTDDLAEDNSLPEPGNAATQESIPSGTEAKPNGNKAPNTPKQQKRRPVMTGYKVDDDASAMSARVDKSSGRIILPLNAIPKDKKTTSRPFIIRKITLRTVFTQQFFLRTFSKIAESHYYLEMVYPKSAMERNNAEMIARTKEVVQQSRAEIENAVASFETDIANMRQEMENNGVVLPEGNDMGYTEPLEEQAKISSGLDRMLLNLIEKADQAVALQDMLRLTGIVNLEEAAANERRWRGMLMARYRRPTYLAHLAEAALRRRPGNDRKAPSGTPGSSPEGGAADNQETHGSADGDAVAAPTATRTRRAAKSSTAE